jgi:hypothetical protein
MTKQTKVEKVRQHLIKKRSITSWDAITKYHATRLADIIFRLKQKGWIIRTTTERQGNMTWARYTLVQEGE